jgi:hypothetical protein
LEKWETGTSRHSQKTRPVLVAEDLLLPSYNVCAWVNLPFLSDHAPICLQIGDGRFGVGQPFKFNPQWMREDSFNNLVKLVWSDTTLTAPGDAQGNIVRKFSRLKALTIHWLKEKKEMEQADLNRIEQELEDLLRLNIQDTSRADLDFKIHCLEEARNKFLREDEERWRLKSRMLWLAGGDKNTRFFHRVASSRRSKKHLWDIEDEDGNLHHSQKDIKTMAYNHFKSFFQVAYAPSLASQIETTSLFPKMVSNEEALALESPCSKEELLEVIKGFKKEKSPGPDGWSVELYLHFFDLMWQDLLDVVEDARTRGVVKS